MLDVSGVDPAQQRLRDEIDGPGSESSAEKLGDGDIAAVSGRGRALAARVEKIAREAQTRPPRQQVVRKQRAPRERETEPGWRRQPVQLPAAQHERTRRAHPKDAIGEPELACEVERGGFRRQHRVRTGFDREPPDALGQDQSPRPGSGFKDDWRQAALVQFVGRGQTGDSGPRMLTVDNLEVWKCGNFPITNYLISTFPIFNYPILNVCTCLASAWTCSSSVSGSTPWPRLKM